MLQLHIQHGSLQRIQTGVASDPPMVVFTFLTMIGNHEDTGSQRLVGSHQRTSVAIASQRLGREKRSSPDMPDRSGLSYLSVGKSIIGTDGLGVIFHDIQMIGISQSHDRLHIAGLSEQVDGHNRLCPFRNSRFYFPGIDIEGIRIDIHQHGRQSQQSDNLGSRYISKCRQDHLIAGLKLQCHQGNLQSIRPVTARDHIWNLKIVSQMPGKGFHLRTIDKGTTVGHRLHGPIDLLFEPEILSMQVDHLYLFFQHYIICFPIN